jgi:hypothetical protein
LARYPRKSIGSVPNNKKHFPLFEKCFRWGGGVVEI